MPAKDIFHEVVRAALEQAGWTITHDPFYLRVLGVEFQIDLGAEKAIGAERAGEKILVEIKSFIGPSLIYDFHAALGQFLNYKSALRHKEPERKLYLAVVDEVYDDFFQRPFVQEQMRDFEVALIVFNETDQTVIRWIE